MLTDAKIKSLKPTNKMYSVSDGEGLAIDVLPNGKKKWTLSYRAGGKQSRKQLGDYPEIGCKQARELSRDVKKTAHGQDKDRPHLGTALLSMINITRC